MARTPYRDSEAEKAYQTIADDSSEPSADIVDPNDQDQKNQTLRTMSVRSTLGKIQRDNKARY